jgi:hypothetical protein
LKKLAALVIVLVILTGCTGKRDEMDRAMRLRADLLCSGGCSFTAHLTADYGDAVHEFTLYCEGWNNGDLGFRVEAPDTISSITGRFKGEEGALTFDDVALAFPLLADGQVTPVSGPWILLKTLLGGYLTACNQEEELLHLTINDSYEDDALQLEIWLNENNLPVQAEIIYAQRRILTMQIENFQIR